MPVESIDASAPRSSSEPAGVGRAGSSPSDRACRSVALNKSPQLFFPEQPTGRLAQGRVVRDGPRTAGELQRLAQLAQLAQLAPLAQVLRDAAVVATLGLLEHQDRQELRLRELLGAEPMRVRWQRPLRTVVGHPGQCD